MFEGIADGFLEETTYSWSRPVRASSGSGKFAETPTSQGTIKGRDVPMGVRDYEQASQFVGESNVVVYLPTSWTGQRDDTLTVGSRTITVVGIIQPSVQGVYKKVFGFERQEGQ